MAKRISTKLDLKNPEIRASFKKASKRLMTLKVVVDILNTFSEPVRKAQSKIFQNMAAISAAQETCYAKLFDELYDKLAGIKLQGKLEIMDALSSDLPPKEKSRIDSDIQKLNKYLEKYQDSFPVDEVNKIASLCLELGRDFSYAIHAEAIRRESNRELNYREKLVFKEKAKDRRYKQYIKYRQENLSKRDCARKIYNKWRKAEPSIKEIDSMLREIRRYAKQHDLEY